MYTFAQSWQKAALIPQTQQLIQPHSYQNQAMTMTMTPLTHGIAATSTKFPSQKTQPMTPTARNPLNQAPLPPHLVNKYLWPQEQGSPKSAGISSPKPLSAVSQQNAWHGVRLNRSSRWLTKANLRHVTKRNPEQGVVVAL